MSARIRRNLPMLQTLACVKPAVSKSIVKVASPDVINALSECCLNILKGHVHLSPAQKRQLCRYKQSLRSLAKKGTSVKRRKQILQKGGFLGALLKPVLGVIGGLLGGN